MHKRFSYSEHVSISQYLRNLWILPVLLLLMQSMIRLTDNPVVNNVSPWIMLIAPFIFIITFTFAAFWTHKPIRIACHQRSPQTLELAMASLPLRAIKGYGLAGLAYVVYLLAVISISSALSEHPLTPRMIVAVDLSIAFGLGILMPTLAIALTMSWMVKTRKQLSLQKLFIGNLEQFHSYPWLIRSSNRPWLIFGVTSLMPVIILSIFTWLMLGTTSEIEQKFILMQAMVLVSHLVIVGIALVWVTSRTVRRITRELATGLNFLRQGKFGGHVAVMVDDDMGDLARGINTALSGLKEREDLKDSLAIASDIQRGLMPRDQPHIPGYTVLGFQESCHSVGGDYYDYIQRSHDSTWLVIADVSGKGYPAALTVANLQAMLHALANVSYISLLDAGTYINQALHQSLQGGRFVTLFLAELHHETHTLEWLNAGHVPPLLMQDGQLSKLPASCPPFGMLESINLHTETITLSDDSVLFACTDGITESKNDSAELFADHRLKAWFAEQYELQPPDMLSSLLAHVDESGFHIHDDDITMICLKRSNHDPA